MFKRIVFLLVIVPLLAACAGVAQRAEERVEPVVEAAIAEGREFNDGQLRRARKYKRWAESAWCNLSKGAIDRGATPEEIAYLDTLDCVGF